MKNFLVQNKYFLLSLLSALLLSLGYLGFSGITLLLAFVPLLYISSQLGEKRRDFWRFFMYVALALGLWSLVTTWWIWYAAPIGAILSVIITVVMMGFCVMLFHYCSKRAPLSLAYTLFVSVWISCEYLYTIGEISFPWIMLGNGFANDILLVQWYEFSGIFGGSLWVLVANIVAWEYLKNRTKGKAIAMAVVFFVPILVSLTLYFSYKADGENISVQVIQPNIDPYAEKFSSSAREQANIIIDLVNQAPQDVDFIVTPETSVNDNLWENHIESTPMIKYFGKNIFDKYPNTQLILGATTLRSYQGVTPSATARYVNDNYSYDIYNSAIVMDSTGVEDIHHKSKLVVGVEKMPYYNITKHLEFLIVDLGGTTGQMGVDSQQKTFVTKEGITHSTAICYESIYGAYFSGFVKQGAEIMFVITNDGWWHDTPGYRQHFSFARLRAIETRRSIARSANTGISGFINPRGEVLSQSKWDERVSLNHELTTNSKLTIYTIYGDVIARICVYTFLLSIMYFVAFTFRKKSHLN